MSVIEKPIVQELTDKQKKMVQDIETKHYENLFTDWLKALHRHMSNSYYLLDMSETSWSHDNIVRFLAECNITLRMMRLANPQWRLTTDFIVMFKEIKQYEEKHAINMFARILSVENQRFILEAMPSSWDKTSWDRKQEIANVLDE